MISIVNNVIETTHPVIVPQSNDTRAGQQAKGDSPKVKMLSALAIILCCCYVSGATGRFIPESTTKITNNNAAVLHEDELMKDITNYTNLTLSTLNPEIMLNVTIHGNEINLESSNNKINESELFENAQEVKENNERSFVMIKQKFKSLWFDGRRPGISKNLFDSDQNFDIPTFSSSYGQINEKPNPTGPTSRKVYNVYGYKPVSSYYTPFNRVTMHNPSGKEYIELLRKPLLRPNQDLFRVLDNDERENEVTYFGDEDDSIIPKLSVQNDQESPDCDYADQQILQYTTARPKTIMDNMILSGLDSDAKLNQYLSDALRQQENEIKRYNCYNASCDVMKNNHQMNIYNGVQHGMRCICNHASPPGRLIEQETHPQVKHMREDGPALSGLMQQLVALPGRHMTQQAPLLGRVMRQDFEAMSSKITTEGVDSDERVIKETEKLLQLTDILTD